MNDIRNEEDSALEIERKFIIDYPNREELLKRPGVKASQITQTYLLDEQPNQVSRVRERRTDGQSVYTKTKKRRINALVCYEDECVIDQNHYEEELKNRDPSMKVIEKERLVVPDQGKMFEIDLYPFWDQVAVLEIELSHPDEPFQIPQGLRVLREVTDDVRFKNASLARCEDLPAVQEEFLAD